MFGCFECSSGCWMLITLYCVLSLTFDMDAVWYFITTLWEQDTCYRTPLLSILGFTRGVHANLLNNFSNFISTFFYSQTTVNDLQFQFTIFCLQFENIRAWSVWCYSFSLIIIVPSHGFVSGLSFTKYHMITSEKYLYSLNLFSVKISRISTI